MALLRQLITNQLTNHVPIMEALQKMGLTQNSTFGKKVPSGAKEFFKQHPSLVIGASALAITAYKKYTQNKRNTITLYAKNAYERRMITSIVDALTKENKFKIIKTRFQNGGKTWELKKAGTQL